MAIYFFSCAGSVSAFAAERMEVGHSLMGTVFILIRKFEVVHCLSNYFSSTKIISKKRLAPAVFFQRYYNYFHIILAAIHFSTLRYVSLTLQFAATQFCQRTFFQCILEHQSPSNKLLIKATIFSEQHRLYWNESCYLKQYFSAERFFSEYRSCLE